MNSIRSKLKTQLNALRTSGFIPNGAMRDFLNEKIDFENKLKTPIKTNIHEIYERFNKLSGKLSKKIGSLDHSQICNQ